MTRTYSFGFYKRTNCSRKNCIICHGNDLKDSIKKKTEKKNIIFDFIKGELNTK